PACRRNADGRQRHIISGEVATENGRLRHRVSQVRVRLTNAGVAAANRDAVEQLKGRQPAGGRRGLVGSLRDADFSDPATRSRGGGQRRLQIAKRGRPCQTVAAGGCIIVHVTNRLRERWRGQTERSKSANPKLQSNG